MMEDADGGVDVQFYEAVLQILEITVEGRKGEGWRASFPEVWFPLQSMNYTVWSRTI